MRSWWRSISDRRRDERPCLFLHAGLHKTGTSALQVALHSHTGHLKSAGILYPQSGIPEGSDGHHNLAWQMTRDRRFNARFGTVGDVAEEIAAHGGTAILSSEDFETLLDRPDDFDSLTDHPGLAGHRVVLVVYLREQSAYFRSLFLELTEHGLTAEMRRLAGTVRQQGYFDFREWRFHFDYHRIVTRLARWRHGSLVLRNYHALQGGSTVDDFLSFTCPGLTLPQDEHQRFIHAQRPLAEALTQYFEDRSGNPLNAAQREEIITACGGDISFRLADGLQRAFAASNTRLARATGWRLKSPGMPPCIGAPLEDLFSFEMQNRLTALA